MESEKLERMLTTSEAAEEFGTSPATLRREAKAGRVPGAEKFLKRWAFDPVVMTAEGWEPPEGSGTGATRTNEDGEAVYRWKIWATKDEISVLRSRGFEVENPREKARQRRARRAEVDEVDDVETGEDLFADFK